MQKRHKGKNLNECGIDMDVDFIESDSIIQFFKQGR